MKWITRETIQVDRMACLWLIKRFVDKNAEFRFVSAEKVLETAEMEGATPFDVPGAEISHQKDKCSFEVLIDKYTLTEPALKLLGKIVHGATMSKDLYKRKEAPGLRAVARGFRNMNLKDDYEVMDKEFAVYDALYAYCQEIYTLNNVRGRELDATNDV